MEFWNSFQGGPLAFKVGSLPVISEGLHPVSRVKSSQLPMYRQFMEVMTLLITSRDLYLVCFLCTWWFVVQNPTLHINWLTFIIFFQRHVEENHLQGCSILPFLPPSAARTSLLDGSGKAKNKTKKLDAISMEKNEQLKAFLGVGLKYFLCSSLLIPTWGRWTHFCFLFFRLGWFNHQPGWLQRIFSRFFRFREASDLAFAVLAIGERGFSSDALVRDAQVNASGSSC